MISTEIMGPGFFIFFQVDPIGGGGQIGRGVTRPSTIPEELLSEDDIAIALALLILTCD